ncbi:MAG: hypothetical protein IKT00_04015 [Prevotella sp.]|nr:hypothetical protein [Prevotella sp.]
MKNLLSILIVLFALCSCKAKWKSPDGKTEEEIISIGYNTGHEWGLEFGTHMYENNGWEKLKEAAKNEYFGEIITSEDNRIFQKFSTELFRGMQEGVRENVGHK